MSRKNILITIKESHISIINTIIENEKLYKSRVFVQGALEHLCQYKSFRELIISKLEKEKDFDYYDLVDLFKQLDKIILQYRDIMDKIIRIIYKRV